MTNNETLEDRITRHEGRRLKPYLDSEGILSIGVGRNLRDRGISVEESNYLFQNDLRASKKDAQKYSWFWTLNEARQEIIIEMCFNLGADHFAAFKHMIAAIEAHDYEGAAHEMVASRWALQVGERANELAEAMLTGTF